MLRGLNKGLCKNNNIEDFYNFARLSLVKDEKHFDRFDLAFKSFYERNINFFTELKKKFPKNGLIMS